MQTKYRLGDPSDHIDMFGNQVLIGDVVYSPDDQPWVYHFTTIGEGSVRCSNANNIGMMNSHRFVNIGPYWANLHLKDAYGNLLISNEELDYHWQTTRPEAIMIYLQKCIVNSY